MRKTQSGKDAYMNSAQGNRQTGREMQMAHAARISLPPAQREHHQRRISRLEVKPPSRLSRTTSECTNACACINERRLPESQSRRLSFLSRCFHLPAFSVYFGVTRATHGKERIRKNETRTNKRKTRANQCTAHRVHGGNLGETCFRKRFARAACPKETRLSRCTR